MNESMSKLKYESIEKFQCKIEESRDIFFHKSFSLCKDCSREKVSCPDCIITLFRSSLNEHRNRINS